MSGNRFRDRFRQKDALAAQLLAVNLKRIRQNRGLTQDQLAADLDIEQSAISLIENARANPGLLLLDAMAKVLECHVRDLFEDADSKTVIRGGRSK